MVVVAEAPFLSEQAKKEEKNRKREARIRVLEEEKRRKKEEEERQKREKELQAIANFRNNSYNNKQVPRIPVKPVVALAKPQPQAPKTPAKVAETPLLAAASAKTVVSNINHYQQQSATTRCTDIIFYVGQIPVKSARINYTPKANILFGRKETQATNVVKTQALAVETQTNQAAKVVIPQTNQAAKVVVPQTNQLAKAVVVVPQTNQPAKEKVVAPATKTTNGQKGLVRSYYKNSNGPDHKNFENGRVTNGGGNGSNQKYYGNGYGQRYNGNGNGQRYYGNRRQENQKKQARPKPVIDAEGWQLVENRRRIY
ncbi:hypothetical protein ACLB2K_054978 [Fragaria x ananassa]